MLSSWFLREIGLGRLTSSWLLSSLSTTILGQVIRCLTSNELWIALEHLYSSRSKAKLLQLKIELQTLKKVFLSMSDYFAKMENIVDQCMVVGYLVSGEDLILSILAGLGFEYGIIIIQHYNSWTYKSTFSERGSSVSIELRMQT